MPASSGTISHQASLHRTGSSKASTVACATNCSTKRCSSRSARRARSSRAGSIITTRAAALVARLHHTSGVRRRTRKETGRFKPASCFTRAPARQQRSVSGCRWTKGGGHVRAYDIPVCATRLDNGQGPIADTQSRLDQLVNGCSATKVVRLTAENPTEVLMASLNAERAPTDDKNTQFTCVLQGMQSMPDLKFGFLGNAAVGGEPR